MSYIGKQPRENITGIIALESQTASGTGSITFDGMDGTYIAYEFHFINLHPASDHVDFSFQVNGVDLSGFDEIITSSYVESYNREDAGNQALTYRDSKDQDQGVAYQSLTRETSNDSDSGVNGILTLYNPSSALYKHFAATTYDMQHQDSYDAYARSSYIAGYIEQTEAIDEIQFKFSSGNIDTGTIKMYGIKTGTLTEVS